MVAKFVSVSLHALKDCFKSIPFDIYIQVGDGKCVKAFDQETGIDFIRLARYESKGVENFYVVEEQEEALKKFIQASPLRTLCSADATEEQKMSAFGAAVEQSLSDALESVELKESMADKAFQAIQTTIENDMDFKQMFQVMLQVSHQSPEFYRHCISTSMFCYLLCLLLDMKSERTLKILLFASLFHDLGRMKLPDKKRIAKNNVFMDELARFYNHPKWTVESFPEPLPFADEEIRRCIVEHKERMDGNGYPKKVKGVHLYPPSKILAIADSFSELTLGLEDGVAYSFKEAAEILLNDQGRCDQKLLKPFVDAILSSKKKLAA